MKDLNPSLLDFFQIKKYLYLYAVISGLLFGLAVTAALFTNKHPYFGKPMLVFSLVLGFISFSMPIFFLIKSKSDNWIRQTLLFIALTLPVTVICGAYFVMRLFFRYW